MQPIYMLIFFIIISITISFAIGGNEEGFATVYGSRILKMKHILILATVFAIIGALALGRSVSETVGGDIISPVSDQIIITVLISTTIWLIVSSFFSIPISTTHATIGAIIGIGVYLFGWSGVNWGTILKMSLWWLLSPVFGFIASYAVYKLIHKFIINKLSGFKDFERMEMIFSFILLAVTSVTALSRAGNDCSETIGIIVGGGAIGINLALIMTGVSLSSGIIILGRRVIKKVGHIVELHPSTAFASEIPTTVMLFTGTLLGIPLSGSHMLVASLVGVAKAQKAPRGKGLWKMVLIWLLTFPMGALLSILIYFPVNFFI